MNLKENISMALDGFRTNKMRSLLTMLGIIIGIASVIGILTVGDSMSSTITGEFSGMGATNIMVMVEKREERMSMYAMFPSVPAESKLTDEMIDTLRGKYPDQIEDIALSESVGAHVFKDGTMATVSGVTPSQFSANNTEIIKGRNFTDIDIENANNSAVMSQSLLNKLIKNGETKGIGDSIFLTVNNVSGVYDVIGVYDDRLNEQDNIYIPIETGKRLAGKSKGYDMITVIANEDVDVASFDKKVSRTLNQFYNDNPEYKVGTMTMLSILDSMTTMMDTLNIALSAIAGISLLVGGIGVMNIMLVTVTERTKEIGTRKALGATGKQIKAQFITEGIIICGIGGIFGMICGAGLGYFGSSLIGIPAFPTVGSVILASGISLAIGVFFSYSPASHAAKLNPIDALRYE